MEVSTRGGNLRYTAKGTSLNRLTQSYVVSAISGMAIIIAAVVAFVMLVSLQTLQEWPISGFGLGLGNGENSGATRAPEIGTPTPNQTATVALNASPPIQAPTVAAGTARNGQAGLGDGSAISGGANGTGHESTGAPTAVPPSAGSGPSSDAGSAAPVESTVVESTGAGSGSGSEGNEGGDSGPRSASGVREGSPDESAATPAGQGESVNSSAGSLNSDKDHGRHGDPAKTSDSSNPASTKTKPPVSKSKPSSTKSAPEPGAPESTPAPAAPDKGAGKPPGPHPHGDPGGSQ
jgi:hypothetical protein